MTPSTPPADVPCAVPLPAPHWILACLCAAWCGTCASYAATFDGVAARYPGLRSAWIDIEAHSDTLGDDALDIENFPTLMLLGPATGAVRPVLFYGTVTPHAGTLERLVQAALAGGLAPVVVPQALAQAVTALALQRSA